MNQNLAIQTQILYCVLRREKPRTRLLPTTPFFWREFSERSRVRNRSPVKGELGRCRKSCGCISWISMDLFRSTGTVKYCSFLSSCHICTAVHLNRLQIGNSLRVLGHAHPIFTGRVCCKKEILQCPPPRCCCYRDLGLF